MEKPARRPQGFKNNFESALQNYQRPNALNIIYWIYWIYDVLLIPKNISNYMYVYTYIYIYIYVQIKSTEHGQKSNQNLPWKEICNQ